MCPIYEIRVLEHQPESGLEMAWPFRHQQPISLLVHRGSVARHIGNVLIKHLLTRLVRRVKQKMLLKVTILLEVPICPLSRISWSRSELGM